MTITFTTLLVWLIIAAVVGFLGEMIAHRSAPDGLIGAIVLGFLAIFLIVGVLHFSIAGEPFLAGVPLISSIIAAVILVVLWSGFAYHRVYRPYYDRYYRRGGYVRRPRRRFFW
ncbi:MAG: transglycosylase [Chloroflexi bacterium]|nr:transglycosylase [Chloroflexota bacterium]